MLVSIIGRADPSELKQTGNVAGWFDGKLGKVDAYGRSEY